MARPKLPAPGEDLVTIARYANAIEAHLARTALEAQDIRAFVADEHIISIDPFYDLGLGGVRLQVFTLDREEALKVLGLQARGSMFVPPRWYAWAILVATVASLAWCIWFIVELAGRP